MHKAQFDSQGDDRFDQLIDEHTGTTREQRRAAINETADRQAAEWRIEMEVRRRAKRKA